MIYLQSDLYKLRIFNYEPEKCKNDAPHCSPSALPSLYAPPADHHHHHPQQHLKWGYTVCCVAVIRISLGTGFD